MKSIWFYSLSDYDFRDSSKRQEVIEFGKEAADRIFNGPKVMLQINVKIDGQDEELENILKIIRERTSEIEKQWWTHYLYKVCFFQVPCWSSVIFTHNLCIWSMSNGLLHILNHSTYIEIYHVLKSNCFYSLSDNLVFLR